MSKIFSQKFSFHSTFFPEFLEFSVKWFALGKFSSFRNFWKLFREISVPFAAVPKFSKVLVEWKAPFIKNQSRSVKMQHRWHHNMNMPFSLQKG